MEYDPSVDGWIVDKYDTLMRIYVDLVEEVGDEVLDDLIRFAIYFVDPLSPIADEKNFESRQADAIRKVNMLDESKRRIKEMDETVSEVIFRYFALVNNVHYQLWFGMRMGFFHMMRQISSGEMDPQHLRMSMKSADEIADDIIAIESILFSDQRLNKLISKKAAEKALTGFAEKYAED